MCTFVIKWQKGSLTASNSLSSGSCCRAEAWWPIPPAPYFSFNDAQINSSTLFQNSSSLLIPRPLCILTSTSPCYLDTRLSVTHNLYSFASTPFTFLQSDFPCIANIALFKLSAYLDNQSPSPPPTMCLLLSGSAQFTGLHRLLTLQLHTTNSLLYYHPFSRNPIPVFVSVICVWVSVTCLYICVNVSETHNSCFLYKLCVCACAGLCVCICSQHFITHFLFSLLHCRML